VSTPSMASNAERAPQHAGMLKQCPPGMISRLAKGRSAAELPIRRADDHHSSATISEHLTGYTPRGNVALVDVPHGVYRPGGHPGRSPT
jgi:hypothetical protein